MAPDETQDTLTWKPVPGCEGFFASPCGLIKTPRGRVTPGTRHGEGYYVVRAQGNARLVHRLVALAYLENLENKSFIDHINRDRLDNRMENLRWVNQAENTQNQSKRQGTTSQYIGVSWNKRSGKWVAQIQLNYKHQHLGMFVCEVEAAHAYDRAARAAGFITANFPELK